MGDYDNPTLLAILGRVFTDLDRHLLEHSRSVEPQPGSRHAEDDMAAYPFLVSAHAHHALAHALDHLRTLRSVLRAGDLPMSAGFTLVRATIENAASAVWVLGPADRDTRVLRRLQLQNADLADAKAVDEIGFAMNSDAERIVAEVKVVGARMGLPRDSVAGKAKSFSSIVREAGDLLPRGGKHAEGTWRLCSGFSHGRPWALASALDREDVREMAPGIMEVQMRAPLQAVTSVTVTAAQLVDKAMALHSKHRKKWITA